VEDRLPPFARRSNNSAAFEGEEWNSRQQRSSCFLRIA